MKLEDALKQYIVQITVNEGRSPRTIKSYEEDLKQYFSFLKEEDITDTESIDDSIIESFLQEQRLHKKATSIARMAASIRSFHHYMNFFYDEKDPSLNLDVHRGVKSLPVFCSVDEINQLMDYFDDTNPKDILNHAILELIYTCGLRVSEAVSLTVNRIDLEASFVRVLGKGNKERIVPIARGSIAILKSYRDYVRPLYLKKKTNLFFLNRFGRKVTTRYVELMLKDVCNQVGIKKPITPHKLRHSYATHMLQGGADLRSIQEMLGHSDIQTTEIYTHVQNKQIFTSYEQFHPGLKGEDLFSSSKKKSKKKK